MKCEATNEQPHIPYTAYGILFLVFVIPELFMTFYMMLKRSLQTSDQTLIQINAYMLTTFAFAVFFPMLLDFVVPLTYSFQHTNDHVSFLQWFQYCTIFIAILCGQYFTSVSFKNKSSWWFLNGFVLHMGDCVIYYDSKGHIVFANPASQQILQMSESDIANINIQQLLPEIDTQQEATYTNVKVKIKNELHTFNIGIFTLKQSLTTSINVLLLSDQTNLRNHEGRTLPEGRPRQHVLRPGCQPVGHFPVDGRRRQEPAASAQPRGKPRWLQRGRHALPVPLPQGRTHGRS